MLDTTKLVIIAAVVVVTAILIWFVLTKTNLGNSLKSGSGSGADTTNGTGDEAAVAGGQSKSFGSG